MKELFTIGVTAENNFNVLPRVTGLFSKRGFGIRSIVADLEECSETSSITIVASGDKEIKEQVVKQLQKLVDVKAVKMIS